MIIEIRGKAKLRLLTIVSQLTKMLIDSVKRYTKSKNKIHCINARKLNSNPRQGVSYMNKLLPVLLISFVTSLLVIACTQQTEVLSDNPKAIIETVNAEWNEALNSGNIKDLAALYTENATISPGNGKTLVGRAEIENLFQGFVESGVHNHSLEVIEVGSSGKLIYQVTKWSAQGAETNGEVPTFGGITTSILEPDSEGKWLARTHVWNMAQ